MKIIFKGGSNEFKKCDEKLMKQFYFINNLVLLEQFQKFFKSFLVQKMARQISSLIHPPHFIHFGI